VRAIEGHTPRKRPSVAAWLIAPAALFFLVFFVLPFLVMALLSVLTGNPLQRPNVTDRPPMSGPGLMLVQGWSGRHR
jgi:ABC-type sugar transport system permease subunit